MSEITMRDRLLIELNVSTTDAEKVSLVDNVLWQAGEIIKNKRKTQTVETKYEFIQFQIAVRLWNIRGIEGQTSHTENGVTRSYIQDGVVSDLLKQVIAPAIVG